MPHATYKVQAMTTLASQSAGRALLRVPRRKGATSARNPCRASRSQSGAMRIVARHTAVDSANNETAARLWA
jgi:hypothetical protein